MSTTGDSSVGPLIELAIARLQQDTHARWLFLAELCEREATVPLIREDEALANSLEFVALRLRRATTWSQQGGQR